MPKKAFITIPVILVLLTYTIASIFLIKTKPDTSKIDTAQKVAEYVKPAVVRVVDYAVVKWNFTNDYDTEVIEYLNTIQSQTLIGGTGSGLIINPNGYILTNAHVVEIAKLDDDKIANEAFNQLVYNIAVKFNYPEDLVRKYMLKYTTWKSVTKHLKIVLPGEGGVYDAEIKSYGAPVGEGKDVSVIKIEAKNLPTLKLGNSETVQSLDNIWVFGYPAAAESDVLSPESSLVVSITNGNISATEKKSIQGAPVLQISAPATHGNSGGPVVNKDGSVIGLLTFRGNTVNGQEVQGFNFAVPINTVKEFLGAAGTTNESSQVDQLYQEGLQLYWAGYYKDALVKFEAVQRLFPGHSEIKKLISNSQQKSEESKILWSNYNVIFIIGDVSSIIIIMILLFITFIRKPLSQSLISVSEEDTENKESML